MADEENKEQEEGQGKKKKLLFLIIGLVLILILSGVAIFLFLSGGSKPAEEQTISSSEPTAGEAKTGAESDVKADAQSAVSDEKKAESSNPTDTQNDDSGKDKESTDDATKTNENSENEKTDGAGKDEKEKDGGGSQETYGFGETYNFKTFHLNLGNALENRFVRLEVAIEYSGGEKQLKEIERRAAQLRDAIISVITRKTREFILSPDGKDALRKEILIRLNRYMTTKLDSVYITDILIE